MRLLQIVLFIIMMFRATFCSVIHFAKYIFYKNNHNKNVLPCILRGEGREQANPVITRLTSLRLNLLKQLRYRLTALGPGLLPGPSAWGGGFRKSPLPPCRGASLDRPLKPQRGGLKEPENRGCEHFLSIFKIFRALGAASHPARGGES